MANIELNNALVSVVYQDFYVLVSTLFPKIIGLSSMPYKCKSHFESLTGPGKHYDHMKYDQSSGKSNSDIFDFIGNDIQLYS